MAANSGSGRGGSVFSLSVRQIVIAGILGGIAIFLGATQLGFIPVPNVAGRATIMHVPVILGGALEGPVVGTIVGLIFGIFSFITAETPIARDPMVSSTCSRTKRKARCCVSSRLRERPGRSERVAER